MLPTERFSDRVQDYVKYRPSYPAEIITHLMKSGILTSSSIVADIGSGTGLLTQLFLLNGNRVFGVEPNAEMRAAGEQQLQSYPHFTSVNAAAEATGLPDGSVDLITAGQAFQWFDRYKALPEFCRILRPLGHVAIIRNARLTNSPLLKDYEELLQKYGTDYSAMDARRITDDVLAEFFHPHPITRAAFPNGQSFDFAGLKGRFFSSSYTPGPDHPQYTSTVDALRRIFDAHQVNNRIRFDYLTEIFTARLHPQVHLSSDQPTDKRDSGAGRLMRRMHAFLFRRCMKEWPPR